MKLKINYYFCIVFYLIYYFFLKVMKLFFASEIYQCLLITPYGLILALPIFLMLNNQKLERKSFFILILFTFFQLIGYMYSNNTLYGNSNLHIFVSWFFSYIFLFSMALNVKLPINKINYLYYITLSLGIIASLYAMFTQLGSSIFTITEYGFYLQNPYESFFGQRNDFGLILVFSIISCIYFYINTSKRKFIYIIVALILLFNLVLTFSRASYLALLIFALVFLIINVKKRSKLFVVFCIILIVFFIIYQTNDVVKEFVNVYMIRSEAGLTGRNLLWNKAISLLNVPTSLFGRGMGIYQVVLENDQLSGGTGFHNMYLDFFVSGGGVYLLVFAYMIYRVLVSIKEINKKQSENGKFYLAIVMALLIYSFFEVSKIFDLNLRSILQTYFTILLPILHANALRDEVTHKLPRCKEVITCPK